MEGEPLSDVRQTLLRALDSIDQLEESGSSVQFIAVVYAAFHEGEEGAIHDCSGWNHSTAPTWLIAALLREGATAIEQSARPVDEE